MFQDYLGRLRANPCGFLRVETPLIETVGVLTAPADPDAWLSLYVTPDLSLNASLFVLDHCAPVFRKKVGRSPLFILGPLPQGKYVVMLPSAAFGRSLQGFPVIAPASTPNLTVEMAFYGGNSQYSLAAFSVRPVSAQDSEQRSNRSQVIARDPAR
ncbi:MAG: hypothetical protein NTW86_14300 [Candidatus Sumerlaeota bacterium]|nr:hypothetical protein [Candidatus Sumerlaeota bacterium]